MLAAVPAWSARVVVSICLAAALAANPAAAQESDEPEEAAAAEPGASADGVEEALPPGHAGQVQREAQRGIEEIVVTGRKRDELLGQTPISIRAFTADELEARSIVRLDEIGLSTANLLFSSTIGSSSSARVYIRGVGQNDARNIKDPGVGIYVDGVYLPRTAGGLLNLVDVESIEVLRGPQGTLFGKNTVGGVINIKSKQPGREWGGDARLRVGNLGILDTQVSLDMPISIGPTKDRLFTRLTFASQTDDGFVENLADSPQAYDYSFPDSLFQAIGDGRVDASTLSGSNSGDNKFLGVRYAVLAEPTDVVRAYFTFDWEQENERGRIGECREDDPFSLGRFVADNWTSFRGDCLTSEFVIDPRQGWARSQQKNDVSTYGTMLDVDWDVTESLALKAIGSWRRRDTDSRGGDFDWTPAEYLASGPASIFHQAFSAELTAIGSAFDEALKYTGGFYFFREEGTNENEGSVLRDFIAGPDVDEFRARERNGVSFSSIDFAASLIDCADNPESQMDPTICAPLPDGSFFPLEPYTLTRGISSLNAITVQDYDTNSYAVYGQASYLFFEKLELTAGLRFTYEEKERRGAVIPFMPELFNGELQPGVPQNDNWSQWTPMAQLSYRFTEDHFAYVQYARGWKSGGFNETVRTQEERDNDAAGGLPETFDPETSDAIEIGFKSSFFDRRLNVNLAGFFTLYDDIQISNIGVDANGITRVLISNAAQGHVAGFELEAQGFLDWSWLPGNDARIFYSGGLGYIFAEYQDFTVNQIPQPDVPTGCESLSFDDCDIADVLAIVGDLSDPPPPVPVDFSSGRFVNTPEWNVNVSATYFFEAGALGTLSFRTNYFWQDDVFFNPENTVEADAYGLLEFRFALDNDRWVDATVAIWLKNALDEVYIENAIAIGSGVGANQFFYGRPRTFGGEFIVRF